MEDESGVGESGGAVLRRHLRQLVDLVTADPEFVVVGVVFVVVVVRYIYPFIFPTLKNISNSSSSI